MKRILSILLALVMCLGMFTAALPQSAAAEEPTETATAGETDYSTGSPWANSNILSNVESSEEPSVKDNFDLAVNGEWVKDNPIASGESSKAYLDSFEDELNRRLYEILSDSTYTDDHNATLVQTYYNAFLDWDARNAAGTEPLMPYLQDIEAISGFDELVAYSTKADYAFSRVFKVGITSSPDDASRKILYINSPVFFLDDPADYADLENMSDYTALTYSCAKEKVQTVLSRCGYTDDEINSIFDGAIAFEQLAAAHCYTLDDANLNETLDTIYSQVYTPQEIESYHWLQYFLEAAANYGIADVHEIMLYDKLDYFDNLDTLFSEENLDLIKDYLLAHTAVKAITLLDRDCFYAACDINNELRGSTGYKDEAKYALEYTEYYLGWPLSRLYTDRYVTAEDKQAVYDVIEEVIGGYKEMLAEEDFLSDATRAEAINKLDQLVVNCMYPDDWSDYDYSTLDLSTDYFSARVEIATYESQKAFDEFAEPISRDDWADTPITMNAYYDPSENSITILCGLIGDVLYNADMPKEEVYAKLGAVVGHEISHAFDPSGANYDATGNYRSWWTDEDYANFEALTDRLVDYYDSITVWDGFSCDGELVKTEACADMGGVAVMLHLAKADPDFDYDTFFRAYAQAWAENITPNMARYYGLYDSHPLSYLRVNATVAQFDEFYETYDVQEGDGMYIAPADRVKIW